METRAKAITERSIDIDGLNMSYLESPGEGRPVLLLHGWGCNGSTMRPVFDCFASRGRRVLAPDFFGFGGSCSPPADFTIFDYVNQIERFIELTCARKPDAIAHSFGGRVATVLAARGKINRLILTGAAGLKPRPNFGKWLKVRIYKLKKRMGADTSGMGSADYRQLPENMKRVFVSVVNEHLDRFLPEIKCPVLLIWGSADRETPLYMARRFRRRIADCGSVVLKDCGHFCFIDAPRTFCTVAANFLGGESEL